MLMGTFLILTSWLVRGLPLWLSIIDTLIGIVICCIGFYILKGIFRVTNIDNIEGEHHND